MRWWSSERRYTADEVWENADTWTYEHKRLELIDSYIYDKPTSSPLEGVITARLLVHLLTYVENHDLGYVYSRGCSYTLSQENLFLADLSFVAKTRLPILPERMLIAPDLAIEVAKPEFPLRYLPTKIERYFQHGTRIMWVIYADLKVIDIYHTAHDRVPINHKGVLDGEEVLPGFQLAVKSIFPD